MKLDDFFRNATLEEAAKLLARGGFCPKNINAFDADVWDMCDTAQTPCERCVEWFLKEKEAM